MKPAQVIFGSIVACHDETQLDQPLIFAHGRSYRNGPDKWPTSNRNTPLHGCMTGCVRHPACGAPSGQCGDIIIFYTLALKCFPCVRYRTTHHLGSHPASFHHTTA